MNPISRGIRNAFRNLTRTFSIILILGLSIGVALAMLVAHQAVNNKISAVKASVGNTVAVTPAGFSSFSSVNNSLSVSQLAPIFKLANVTNIAENFTARLNSTVNSSNPLSGFLSSSNAKTNLSSPVKLNLNSKRAGRLFFAAGGNASSFSLANFSLPISLLATNDPSLIDSTNITLSSGKMIQPSLDNNQALVSQQMASKNNLKVGSTFSAYSSTLTVSGIFSSANQSVNNTVIVSLPTGQAISGQSGVVTNATVYVNSLDNLNSVTNAIKKQLGSVADVTSSVQAANNTVQPLNSVESISIYSLIGAVIAGAIIIFLTMVMIVRERTREIGVIKAIGASNSRISLQFMSEAVTLTFLGAVVGMILAIVAASPITHMLVSSSTSGTANGPGGFNRLGGLAARGAGGTRFLSGGRGAGGFLKDNFNNIHAAVGWNTLIFGLLATLLIALIGSFGVSFFIAKIRPAEVMRTE